MEEYKTYKLKDITKGKGCYGIAASAVPYSPSLLAYLRITDINDDGTLNRTGLMSVDDANATNYLLEPNDIVFARTGNSTGRTYFYDGSDGELVYAGFLIKFSLDDKKVNPRILKYYTHSKPYYDWVHSFDTGGTRGNINAKTFGNLPLVLPSRKAQDRIVEIMKSFDDKIEVNRRINDNFTLSFLLLTCFVLWLLKLRNDNLQQQADALFKSFFVDFELFIEGEFIETELGLIPKNWKILSFGDFIVALTEKAPVDSLPEYSVTNNGIIPRVTKFNKKLSKSSSMNKVLRKNNLVFGMSREILNWGIMEDEIGGVSSAYNIYKIDEDLVDPTYLRLYMKAKIAEFNSLIGTAAREGQSLDKGQLMQKKIYVPTKDVLQDFFAHYVPIMESIHNAEQESSRLAQLRDALLPKLMSDELKIS